MLGPGQGARVGQVQPTHVDAPPTDSCWQQDSNLGGLDEVSEPYQLSQAPFFVFLFLFLFFSVLVLHSHALLLALICPPIHIHSTRYVCVVSAHDCLNLLSKPLLQVLFL